MKFRNFLVFCIAALLVQTSGVFAQIDSASTHNSYNAKNYSRIFKDRFQSILGKSLLASAEANNIKFSAPGAFDDDDQTSVKFDKRVQSLMNSPVFARFEEWLREGAENSNVADQSEYVARGEAIAAERRTVLDQLIKLNPQAALEKAIAADKFKNLPASVKENSEKRISAVGDFFVYAIDEMDHSNGKIGDSHIEREVVIGETRYKALVYGRRELMTTKMAIPLQGIVVGDTMVVDENPARIVDAAEIGEKSAANDASVTAEVGGKLKKFADRQQLETYVNEQIEWESKIGPTRDGENGEKSLTSAWTEGQKSVLVIRVDFPDRVGEPISSAEGLRLMNNEVNPFYLNSSYNKTSLVTTVTPLLRMPQPQSSYSANALLSDAYAVARAAGYDVNNYNLDVTMFAYTSRFGWAGLASVGGRGNLINGAWQIEVVAHELGHNYGLLHANQWRSSDTTSPIGSGSNVEYGDCYDLMGACYNMSPFSYFNTHYKRLLNWLSDSEVQTVTSTGTYRIYAQDANTSAGIRTLKINKDASKNYWVEFRQRLGGNSANGALLRWDYSSQNYRETQLLDMNPSTTSVADAPLLVGQSFYDSASRIRITVVGKGGTSPESLDVRVELNSNNTTTPTPTPNTTPTPTTPTPTPACTYTLSPTLVNVSAAGGSGTFTVSTQTGCTWNAVSNQGFVSVTSGNVGNGSGTVFYSVAANSSTARTGTISAGGKTFTISQAGTTTGSYSLSASPTSVAPGGKWVVNFTAPAGASYYDWVGLFKVGTPNSAYLNYGYTTGAPAGSFDVVAPTEPGQYEFRYLLNNSTATSVVTSNVVTVTGGVNPTPTPATPTPTPATPTPTPATPTPTPATPTPTPNATPTPTTQRVNVALASSGATATASSDSGAAYAPVGAINGSRTWANGAGWRDGSPSSFPDWLQINFAGTKTINQIDVYSVRDDFSNASDPVDGETFSVYGITDFEVQYWTGSNWANVQNGVVSGNNQVVRKVTFNAVSTANIRIVVNQGLASYSRIVEVEAWSGGTVTATPTPTPTATPATPTPTPNATPTPATPTPTPAVRANVALASSGATATASSDSGAAYAPVGAINGSRTWANGAGWRDGSPSSFPDWLQVDFAGTKTINEIDLYFVRDDFGNASDPTDGEMFSLYGVTDFEVQYWTGSNWANVPNGAIYGNNQLVRKVTFAPISTSRVRVVVNGAQNSYSRVVELEAWTGGSAYVLESGQQNSAVEQTFGEKVTDWLNYAYDSVSNSEKAVDAVPMP